MKQTAALIIVKNVVKLSGIIDNYLFDDETFSRFINNQV